MTRNPLIVFVVPESLGKNANQLPIGLTATAVHAPLRHDSTYQVLMLDDGAPVPAGALATRCPEDPLFIVAHGGSTQNANPEGDATLKSWGMPYVVRKYNRIRGSECWRQIESLAQGSLGGLASFIEAQCGQGVLQRYEQLAAICQIEMLDPNAELPMLDQMVKGLPSDFRNEFLQATDPAYRLEIVRKKASAVI